MKRKVLIGVLFLSVFFNVILIGKFVFLGTTEAKTPDGRTEIKMTKENREFVMAEMRTFLESIQSINVGLAEKQPSKIFPVSEQSGTCKVDSVPNSLIKTLPFGFKTMGMETHALFDEISKMSRENKDQEEIQKTMNRLLNNCVACHKTYKITTY
ncbi:cytochrome c [Chryseobacterium sp.]|uniref:cytochrome c n=1 Tax=Chryseobacterium sp. TaxID=1871047 RepID=UPI0025C2AFE3|nr:cytochrome c [Chryseobacterium sp.]